MRIAISPFQYRYQDVGIDISIPTWFFALIVFYRQVFEFFWMSLKIKSKIWNIDWSKVKKENKLHITRPTDCRI